MATAVDELLDMLYDMIDEARNAAFSGDKCVIDRDKALDLIEDAKNQLPVDLAEARKILNARNEYLAAAKREAEEIRKRAEIEANQMVSEAPVMAQARQKAREVLIAIVKYRQNSTLQGSIRGRLTKSMDVNFRSALELMRMMQMMEIA